MSKNTYIKYLVTSAVLITTITTLVQANVFAVANIALVIPPAAAQSSTNSSASTSNMLTGEIASLQNNKEGKPAWILEGPWNMTLANPLDKSSSTNPPTANSFNAKFEMVMLNGSAKHEHSIYGFKQTSSSSDGGESAKINGTATITMKDGPVADVPVGISIMQGKAVSISPDSTKTMNHFGDSPIFGIVSDSSK
jgi:hypothetical protein